ncbi:MAG TPA: chaperonin [Desulfotomaculum sp.]|nr:MAG: Chaperonin Cpn60/TCP-1 [Desulfotomaculum sp. 46_80]KUK85405.1 MAG: Chaperonin Cpn60/TCP-1 [Desulfofundulus kuznetsovii]HAG09984.1 chaperonin [Desulfotomaculum sp.]HBY03374.1 chaperonin [Desulfotomaculum sp.]
MNLKQQASGAAEVEERMAALVNNSNAIRSISSAVEGTLGPKGLDTMLVDKYGDIIITNDGVTILTQMEANHPAARMLINIARAQQEEVGDGTTTATIMAGAMVGAGVEQVARGVPVNKIIEGMRLGLGKGLELMAEKARPVESLEDPLIYQIALVAGRGQQDIAGLVVSAAKLIGKGKLLEKNFRFSDAVRADERADNAVFMGVIINRGRMNRQMPMKIEKAKVLIIDDALEPEEVDEIARSTESGVKQNEIFKTQFRENIYKIVDIHVGLVLADRGISEIAEEIFTDNGIIAVERVAGSELRKAADHTGAWMIKRSGLNKNIDLLSRCLGSAGSIYNDEKNEQVRICDGEGNSSATVVVSAATREVVGERERIARDAAAAVQSAVRGGVVPGGGALEIFLAREIDKMRSCFRGMTAYGIECIVDALKRPLAQIVSNAGFNPLEKVGDVLSLQEETGNDALAVDCDTGQVCDMYQSGVVDPVLVKTYAFKAAEEVAEAILRIDTIIKKKEDRPDFT